MVYVSVKVVHGVFPTGSYHGPKTAHAQIVEIREMHVEVLSALALVCIRLSLGLRGGSSDARSGARHDTPSEAGEPIRAADTEAVPPESPAPRPVSSA